MNTGKLVFAQRMAHLPLSTFRRCVSRYHRESKVKQLTCQDQFLNIAFAQLTYCESLPDIEACLHRLYVNEPFGLDLKETVYALDATTDWYLPVFPWAPFHSTKAAIRLHTRLDLRGKIPSFIHISDGKWHAVNVPDILIPEPGAFYIMDRGYLNFSRLHTLHKTGGFFVIRAKSNPKFQRRYSRQVDRTTDIVCDRIGTLTGVNGCGAPYHQRRLFDTSAQGRRIKHGKPHPATAGHPALRH